MGRLKKKFNLKLTPAEFEDKVYEYFDVTPDDRWTFASLYLYVGVSDTTFKRMAKRPEFRDAAEYAKMRIMDGYQRQDPFQDRSDKAEIEMAVEGTVKVEDLLKGGKIRAK